MVCHTAHAYAADIQADVKIPFVSIIDVTVEELEIFVGSNAERAEDINWDDILDVYGIFTYYDDNDNGIECYR